MSVAPITILLVEDEPAHAEIVRRNMEASRVANRIFWVEDGQAAMDYLLREGAYTDPAKSPVPGLILLDLRLPKMDGLEVLEAIKTNPRLSVIPVVVMTTSAAEIDVANAYHHHANSYVVKPIDLTKFTTLLDALGYFWLAFNKLPALE